MAQWVGEKGSETTVESSNPGKGCNVNLIPEIIQKSTYFQKCLDFSSKIVLK